MPDTKTENNNSSISDLIITRFRIESRGNWQGGGSWLIVYDKMNQSYVKDTGGRAYKRFRTSDDVVNYLVTLL